VVRELRDESVVAVLVGDCKGEVEARVDFGQQVLELGLRYEDEGF
jgi:hypothetical protein